MCWWYQKYVLLLYIQLGSFPTLYNCKIGWVPIGFWFPTFPQIPFVKQKPSKGIMNAEKVKAFVIPVKKEMRVPVVTHNRTSVIYLG